MVPLTINFFRAPWRLVTNAHPLARGVASYAILWPTGSLVQQTLEGKNFKTYDWARAMRFSIYGALYVAPTLYGWVRLTSLVWPKTNLQTSLVKAVTEQLSYGPFACASFFMGMSLLEGKSTKASIQEVKDKFWPTYTVGICVWPILQTINFSLVPEPNRIVFVSVCSLIWTSYLAYVKKQDREAEEPKAKIEYLSNP